MFDALCKSGRRTKYSVLSNKNSTFERINTVCVSHLLAGLRGADRSFSFGEMMQSDVS